MSSILTGSQHPLLSLSHGMSSNFPRGSSRQHRCPLLFFCSVLFFVLASRKLVGLCLVWDQALLHTLQYCLNLMPTLGGSSRIKYVCLPGVLWPSSSQQKPGSSTHGKGYTSAVLAVLAVDGLSNSTLKNLCRLQGHK